MRAKEFLLESEGGMLRRAEEAGRGKRIAFKNTSGKVITLITAAVITKEPGDAELRVATPPQDQLPQQVPPQDQLPQQVQQQPQVNQGATSVQENISQGGSLHDQIVQYAQENNVNENDIKYLPAAGGLSTVQKAEGALVLIFIDEETQSNFAYVAPKQKLKSGAYPIFLQTKFFSDITGFVQLSSKAGEEDKVAGVQERALTNLKPVGIIATNTEISVDDIVSNVESTIADRGDLSDEIKEQVVQLLEAVSQGSANPIANANKYVKSFEIDLGETAAPIALIKQKFVSGDWKAAEENILSPLGATFGSLRGVTFPNDPAEKLYDSYLVIDDNNVLRVSSKDKAGGAKASVSGLVDDVNKYPERYEDIFSDKDYEQLIEIVKIIKDPDLAEYMGSSKKFKRNGAIAGALQLGVLLSVISKQQSDEIVAIIDSDEQYLSDKQLGDLKGLLTHKSTNDDTRNDYRIGWHLLASVAAAVSKKVNSNPKTDMFFKALLERSNMIQVKTTLKSSSAGAYFSNFHVIYPPVFTGKIQMDASSNFYATRRPVGKIGFSIK